MTARYVAIARAAALVMLAVGSLGAQGKAAPDSTIEAQTRALSSMLRCPVCQGESIQDSPSELSAQMRDLVRDQLRSGKTPEQVKQYFVDRYGEWILLEPKPRGANLLLYIFPIAAVLGGLLFVWRVVRRWTSPSVDPPVSSAGSQSGNK